MKDLWPRLKNYLIPVIALIVVNFIYFYPVLQGEKIAQDDIMLGRAKGKEIRDYRTETGDEPLWTQAMFSGMPTFQISTLYPDNIFEHLSRALTYLGKPSSIYIIALLMIGFYILLLTMKVDPWLSFAGAIAFGFSAFFIISLAAGHNAKVRAAAYIPMVVAGVLMTYRGKKLLGFALTALFMGLAIAANHFQITYYLGFIILSIIVAQLVLAIRERTIPEFMKASFILLAAALIGIGPNIGNLWSTISYTKETMRGGSSELSTKADSEGGLDFEYAMSWSYGKAETMTLFIPNFMGGGAKQSYEGTKTYELFEQTLSAQGMPRQRVQEAANQYSGSYLYWGDQSLVNGGYYVGASLVFLFVFGLFILRGRMLYWIIPAALLSLFMAWGKNLEWFNSILFEYLPLFNKFRVPSMALVILFFLIPFTGMMAVKKLVDGEVSKEELRKRLLHSLYFTGGLALFVALLGPAFFDMDGLRDPQLAQNGFDTNLLLDDRASLMRNSAFRTLFFVGLAFGICWFYLQGKIPRKFFPLALAVLFAADLWTFDKDQLGKDEFISEREYDQNYAPSPADQIILKDDDIHYRVYNTTAGLTSDSYTSYFHKSIGGYHGAKLIRYQDLIENQLSKGNPKVYDMLNAKWFILQDKQGGLTAQPNFNALGNAWFVDSLIWVPDADSEMEALSEFSPSSEAVVDLRYEEYLQGLASGSSQSSILLQSYDPKEMIYKADVKGGDQLAVFSEIYYEGHGEDWKAYIDGKHVPHIRVNYLLRGLRIPPGQHEVIFRFEPYTYLVGEKIDLAFSSLFVLAFIGGIFGHYRKSKKEGTQG